MKVGLQLGRQYDVAKVVSSPAGAKRKFTKLDDIHYYSLAPSPIRVRFYRSVL